MSADVHGRRPYHPHQYTCREAHERGGRERSHHVVEQATHAAGEDFLFSFLGVISLDHPNAAQRFGEAACYLGINLAAFAENGSDRLEGPAQCSGKATQRANGDQSQWHTRTKQQHKRNASRDQPSSKIHQPGAQQIANAFYVGHNARDQRSGFVGIIESHRQVGNVRLHLLAEVRNQPLRRF
jgi:hypothetical protein